ncbi:unnamed protein product [Aspergillus oryzae RIB40]|uniref:Aspirochlorine biosynthesis protein N n=2 Tax=Aspergillus oryzae TaxID=5062 RepID=ACLN_ASPOR|nr:unnamed protein product [Aspergillus oryzae RIB40]Q2UPB6.1 RecName: Full=Aspirochlorine biosynthesis protein N [Aspergillus oryzae RIB40]BAE56599.1 unnamed protein product [Aspergillus oryzae RIB40]
MSRSTMLAHSAIPSSLIRMDLLSPWILTATAPKFLRLFAPATRRRSARSTIPSWSRSSSGKQAHHAWLSSITPCDGARSPWLARIPMAASSLQAQSPLGARRRVYQHLPEEADRLLKGRAQIVNVWRPLRGPVQDWPLAVMDCSTLAQAHIHPTKLYRNRFELRGETVSISHDESQRWYYLDGQQTDECTLIKIWDSKEGISGHMCAHCAFQHPNTPVDAPLRESVEVRCLVFYENQE